MDVKNKSPNLTKAHARISTTDSEPNVKKKKSSQKSLHEKCGLLEKIGRGLRVHGLTVIIRTEFK